MLGLWGNSVWKAPLVQPLAESRITYKVRPACVELYLVQSWKNLQVFHLRSEKGFPIIYSETPVSQLMRIVPHPPTMHHCKEPVSCLLDDLPCRYWKADIRFPLSLLTWVEFA